MGIALLQVLETELKAYWATWLTSLYTPTPASPAPTPAAAPASSAAATATGELHMLLTAHILPELIGCKASGYVEIRS